MFDKSAADPPTRQPPSTSRGHLLARPIVPRQHWRACGACWPAPRTSAGSPRLGPPVLGEPWRVRTKARPDHGHRRRWPGPCGPDASRRDFVRSSSTSWRARQPYCSAPYRVGGVEHHAGRRQSSSLISSRCCWIASPVFWSRWASSRYERAPLDSRVRSNLSRTAALGLGPAEPIISVGSTGPRSRAARCGSTGIVGSLAGT